MVPWGAGPWAEGPAYPKHTVNWTSISEPGFAILFIFSLQLFCFVRLLKSLVIIMFSAFLTHS